MTFVLGLTGGIASGKTTADNFFLKQKIPVVDGDQIAREILRVNQPGWQKIKEEFGQEYLEPDQTINRQKLGEVIFNNEKKRQLLDQITHPLIFKEIEARVTIERQKNTPVVVVDVPLLFEEKRAHDYDATLLITLPPQIQLERLMQRNHLTKDAALARINSQMPLSVKERLATYAVSNTGTIKELELKLAQILIKIKEET